MEGRLVLKRCSVFRADGRIRSRMAVVIEKDRITRLAPDAEVPVLPGDWAVACRDRLLVPGLTDCHTHLVGGQLAPVSGEHLLQPPETRAGREQALAGFLTPQEIEVLTSHAMAQALRSGVTMVVEHLFAPNAVESGLAAQARAARKIGIRLANSHASTSETSDADGIRQLEENAAYCRSLRDDPMVRPALGSGSSSKCGDELLRRLGRLREELGVGLHVHLSESEDDLTSTFARYGKRIVPRFESFGLLGAGVVAAYCRAINRNESERLMRTRTLAALSPRLGIAAEPMGGGLEPLLAYQNLLGLGTSGTGSLWIELFASFVASMHLARVGRLLDPDGLLSQLLIGGPAELCSMLFGGACGNVEAGSLADLVLYDVVPVEDSASAPHVLMGLGRARVAWTLVGGRVCVREGELLGTDFLELSHEAARVLQTLARRTEPPRGA